MRDVRSVASKLKVVLLPMERSVRLFAAGYRDHISVIFVMALDRFAVTLGVREVSNFICVATFTTDPIWWLWGLCRCIADRERRIDRTRQRNYSTVEGLGFVGSVDCLPSLGSSLILEGSSR